MAVPPEHASTAAQSRAAALERLKQQVDDIRSELTSKGAEVQRRMGSVSADGELQPPPPPPPPREKQVRDMSPRRVSDPANTQAQQPTPQAHGGAGMVLPQSSGSVGAVPSPAPIARVSPARTSPVRVSPVRPARLDAAVAAPVSPRSPAAAAAADGGEEEQLRLRSKLAMQERQLEAFRKQVELQQGLVERAVGQLEARHTEKERGTERELRRQAAHDRELLLLSAAAQAQRTSPVRRAPALPEVRFDPNPVLALPLDEVLVACPAFRRNFDGCDATRRLEIRTSWGPGCAWLSPLLKECFLQDNFAPLGLPADTDAHPASLLSGVLPAGNAHHHHHHPPHHPPYGAAAHNVAGGNARFDSATISPQRNRHAAVEVTPPPPQQHRALVSPSKRRPPPESSVQLVRSPAKPFPHASPPRPERTSASVQPPVAAAPTATAAPDAAISHGAWSAAPSGQPPPPLQHAQQQQQQPPSHHQQQVAPPSLYHHQPPPQSQPPSPSRQQQQQPLPATSLIEQGIANEIAFRTTPTTTTLTAAAPAATHHGDPSTRHTDDSAAAAAAAVRDAASLAEENRQLRRTVDELRATTAALEERVASWEAATADVQAECARRGEALAALRQEQQQQQHRSVQRSDSVGAAEAATRKHDALLGALRARDARAAALEGEAASQSRRATAAEDECLLLGDAVREREAALRQAEGVLREKERHAAAQSCEMAELRARLARVEQQQQQQQQQQRQPSYPRPGTPTAAAAALSASPIPQYPLPPIQSVYTAAPPTFGAGYGGGAAAGGGSLPLTPRAAGGAAAGYPPSPSHYGQHAQPPPPQPTRVEAAAATPLPPHLEGALTPQRSYGMRLQDLVRKRKTEQAAAAAASSAFMP